MSADGSVAPKERVNIVYKSETGGAQRDIELPFKQLVVGEFATGEDAQTLAERQPVSVDKDNFTEVLRAQNLQLNLRVPQHLGASSNGEENSEMDVSLSFKSMRDFEPDAIAAQVPELAEMVALREALKALKGPLGNMPDFRRHLQALIADPDKRERLLQELAADKKED